MALKPTIFRFTIALADGDRNCYEDLNLTVAQHPSETIERMLVRVLVYCLHFEEHLEFTSDLSDTDQPALAYRSLDGNLIHTFEVGEPGKDRLIKASRLARNVSVYTFNRKSDTWWKQLKADIEPVSNVSVYQFAWESIQALASNLKRSTGLSVTINRPSVYVAAEKEQAELFVTDLTDRST
ncbi:MAG: YaeQ family protein [Proteobacteria bacterium]|nr:YaeQ family protein [Pseudomonadota bacterium]